MSSTWKMPTVVYKKEDFFSLYGYTVSRVLGQGSYGEVVLATSSIPGQQDRALKRFPIRGADGKLNQREVDNFRAEAIASFNLKHHSVVKTFGYMLGPRFAYIFMPVYAKGDLFRNIPLLNSKQVLTYSASIACAVHYLHRNRVVHRDIKVNNILLTSSHAVLSDLGLAVQMPAGEHTVDKAFGHPTYRAPEMKKKGTLVPFCPFKVSVCF